MGARSTGFAPQHTALKRQAIGNSGWDPSAAPSMAFLGDGLQDHRFPVNARGASPNLPGILGWYGGDPIVADYVPSTLGVATIATTAANATVTSGTPMTLISVTTGGITVLTAAQAGPFLPNPIRGAQLGTQVFGTSKQNTVPAGACVIDGIPQYQMFGNQVGAFNTGFFDPATCVGRAVTIGGSASAAGGAFIVNGFDVYGFAMQEQITAAAGAGPTNGKKAWKAITSVVPQFTDAHPYSVGTTDIYGLGIFTRRFSHLAVVVAETWITASTGFVAADTTSPATAITGDVRGTYALQTPSNGTTTRLVIYATPSIADIAANPTTGLFGVPQFGS